MNEVIDWSKAPKGYPVWIKDPDGVIADGWHKECSDRYIDVDGGFWSKPEGGYEVYKKPQPTWNGTGLPPVGTVCEAGIPHSSGEDDENKSSIWIEGSVIAHHKINGKTFTWFAERDGFYPPNVLEFRTILTPEQRTADERDAAIEEIENMITGYSYKKCAEIIYDAGFRNK